MVLWVCGPLFPTKNAKNSSLEKICLFSLQPRPLQQQFSVIFYFGSNVIFCFILLFFTYNYCSYIMFAVFLSITTFFYVYLVFYRFPVFYRRFLISIIFFPTLNTISKYGHVCSYLTFFLYLKQNNK